MIGCWAVVVCALIVGGLAFTLPGPAAGAGVRAHGSDQARHSHRKHRLRWVRQPVPGRVRPNATTGKRTAHCPPRLNGNGTVTFYWCKRGAKSVSVSGEFAVDDTSLTLTKDAKTGVWSGTVALADGLLAYSFTVNGASGLPDPSNPPWESELDPPVASSTSQDTETGKTGSEDSELYVPADNDPKGNPVSYDAWLSPYNRVRHGTLHHYLISAPDTEGTFAHGKDPISVYLPPGYEANCSRRYPALYLLHGTWGNDVDWSTQGYVGIIEDNLLAKGLAKPMVIVMPNFNNTKNEVDPATGVEDTVFPEDGFRDDLMKAYIPWAQAHFCLRRHPADRAFAGLSQGADDSLNVLENDARSFSSFGVWSPVCLDVDCPPKLTSGSTANVKCIQFGSGVNDAFASESDVTALQADFDAAGIPTRLHMTPTDDDPPRPPATDPDGQPDVVYEQQTSHTWYSWREQLRDSLMYVFFRRSPRCSV